MNTRRRFIAAGPALAFAPALLSQGKTSGKWTVGVIGHTGRGNYGHELDKVWNLLDETRLVAVADADPGGLAKAKDRLKVERGYADYRDMLDDLRPDLVAVCPRHVDQRVPMIRAACEAGAKGVYVEKPFARSLEEADQIAAACAKAGTKLAVAHRNRHHPAMPILKNLLTEGLVGDVLELRGRGKEDRRGGGEDLWVLGTHVLDLFHYLAGQPLSCSAEIRQDGRLVTKADVAEGAEGLGPLAGDEIHARWRMANGWTATFDSLQERGRREAGFGFQVVGNLGVADVRNDREPLIHFMEGSPWEPARASRKWVPLTSAGVGKAETADVRGTVRNHFAVVRDLLDTIEKDRPPLCGLAEGVVTVEMVSSVFESHRLGGRLVTIPLKNRKHPLSLLN